MICLRTLLSCSPTPNPLQEALPTSAVSLRCPSLTLANSSSHDPKCCPPQPLYCALISVYTSRGRAPVMKASVLFRVVWMLASPCFFLWANVSAWEAAHCLRALWEGRGLSLPFADLGQALEVPLRVGEGRTAQPLPSQSSAEPMAGVQGSAGVPGPVL